MKQKIKVTQKQRDNLLEALNVMWPSVPPENVFPALAAFRSGDKFKAKPTCGTVACFGGWCAWWPSFRAQGVRVNPDNVGAPMMGNSYWAAEVAEKLFGDYGLFMSRLDHESGTDHEVVTARLKKLLANSEVAA